MRQKSLYFDCHSGLDPESSRRPDESREPSQRLDPGFHREPWIPAFAGMTASELCQEVLDAVHLHSCLLR